MAANGSPADYADYLADLSEELDEERAQKKKDIKNMLRRYEMVESEGAAKVLMSKIIRAIDRL